MERQTQASALSYKVKVTREAERDLEEISPEIARRLLALAAKKLSAAPDYFGEPLKGAEGRLWKMKPGDYRILYLVDFKGRIVHLIAIRHRKDVYRQSKLETYLKIAESLLK